MQTLTSEVQNNRITFLRHIDLSGNRQAYLVLLDGIVVRQYVRASWTSDYEDVTNGSIWVGCKRESVLNRSRLFYADDIFAPIFFLSDYDGKSYEDFIIETRDHIRELLPYSPELISVLVLLESELTNGTL